MCEEKMGKTLKGRLKNIYMKIKTSVWLFVNGM